MYRRNLQRGFGGMGAALPMALRYVGGTYNTRVLASAGQPLTRPVPAAQQQAALDMIVTEYFGSAAFRFDPAFLNRLGVEQFDRLRGTATPDFSLPQAVLNLQRGALDALMTESRMLVSNLTQAAQSMQTTLSPDSSLRIYAEQATAQLADAARTFRVLADELERHPEYLLRGKGNRE